MPPPTSCPLPDESTLTVDNVSVHSGVEDEDHRFLRRDNVRYLISGEFDNKMGPKIEHQYPDSIPGFKSCHQGNLDTDEFLNLASLMIPNNVEYTPGKKDFTVFKLYYNRRKGVYELFKPMDVSQNTTSTIFKTTGETSGQSGDNVEEDDDEDDHHEFEDANDSNDGIEEDILYFINVVNTIIDTTNDRGAVIKSIALGTTTKLFSIFKPLLSEILDQYMSSKDMSLEILKESFDMINNIDMTFINKLHSRSSLQQVLRSIPDQTFLKSLMSIKDSNTFNSIFKTNYDTIKKSYQLEDKYVLYSLTNFKTTVLSDKVKQVKLRIPLIESDLLESVSRYHRHIFNFLSKFIAYVSKLQPQSNSWKLIINSTTFSKDELCQFISLISNFINELFDNEQQVYFQKMSIMVFPYMDISMVDFLKQNLIDISKKSSHVFAIVGVANPIFQYQQNLWDCYYDLDSEILYDSLEVLDKEKVDISARTKNVQRNGSISIRKMFSRPANVIVKSAKLHHIRTGLILKCVQTIIAGKEIYDASTIFAVFKRVHLLQLIAHIQRSRLNKRPLVSNFSTMDEYMMTFKDLIVYPDFFDHQTMNMLGILIDFYDTINSLYGKNVLTKPNIANYLLRLKRIQRRIFILITTSRKSFDSLIYLLLHFPCLRNFEHYDLMNHDFSLSDLEKALEAVNVNNIYADIEKDACLNRNWIGNLTAVRGFMLIASPLLFDPKSTTNINLFNISTAQIPRSSVSSGSGKGRLTRSLSFKKLFPLAGNSLSSNPFSLVPDTQRLFQEEFGKITQTGMIQNSSTSKHSNDQQSTSPQKPGKNVKGEFEDGINKCRKMAVKIIHAIFKDPVASLLLKHYTTNELMTKYESTKQEFYGRSAKDAESMNRSSSGRSTKGEILKDLTIIGES